MDADWTDTAFEWGLIDPGHDDYACCVCDCCPCGVVDCPECAENVAWHAADVAAIEALADNPPAPDTGAYGLHAPIVHGGGAADAPETPRHRKHGGARKPFVIEWRLPVKESGIRSCDGTPFVIGWDWRPYGRYETLRARDQALEVLQAGRGCGWKRISRDYEFRARS